MQANNNERLIREGYVAFNQKDYARFFSMLDEKAVISLIPLNRNLNGIDQIRSFFEGWVKTFPDMQLEVQNIMVNDHGGFVELAGRGTHRGTLKTPFGEVEATGKKVEIKGCDVFKIRSGKVTSVHVYFDLGMILKQVGLESLPQAA